IRIGMRFYKIISIAIGLVWAGPLYGADPTVTFNNQVARIFQQHCQTCHRPGNVAPFPLLTYTDALTRATLIKRQVESREMPPWKPVHSAGVFEDERTLT